MISPAHPQGNSYYALYSLDRAIFGSNKSDKSFDISIASNSNANKGSNSDFGCSFKHQDYPAKSEKARTILAGSHNFQTIDIEVFTKKD